jgi:hypothetical protein
MSCIWIAASGINHLKFLRWTERDLMPIIPANIAPSFHFAWKSR